MPWQPTQSPCTAGTTLCTPQQLLQLLLLLSLSLLSLLSLPPLLLPPPPPLLLLQPVTPLLFPLPALLLRRKLMEDVVNLPDYSNQTRLDMTTRNCAQTVIQGTLDLGKVGGEWVGARNKPAMWHCPEAS